MNLRELYTCLRSSRRMSDRRRVSLGSVLRLLVGFDDFFPEESHQYQLSKMLLSITNSWILGMLVIASQVSASGAILPWSQRMLDSIIIRQQGTIASSASTGTIANGILALALNSAIEQYPQLASNYSGYRQQVLDLTSSNLVNETADARLPLDRFSISNAIRSFQTQDVPAQSINETRALEALDNSFALQKRNYLGGLWYYAAYPEWSYLDGMFSALPYLALSSGPNVTDISLQISLLYSHCLDPDSGLLVHGYDASQTAVWADRVSGASPYVWGRSLGWYMTALVQTHEILCDNDKNTVNAAQLCASISSQFTSLASSLLTYADNATGAWFQLTTFPNQPGNWLESSSTVLFIYTLLSGLRLGLLPINPEHADTITSVALKAFEFTTTSGQFVQDLGNGTLAFNGTVTVCSLNSTATYDYYTGRPIEENSLIGEAAFVLAALEVEKTGVQI